MGQYKIGRDVEKLEQRISKLERQQESSKKRKLHQFADIKPSIQDPSEINFPPAESPDGPQDLLFHKFEPPFDQTVKKQVGKKKFDKAKAHLDSGHLELIDFRDYESSWAGEAFAGFEFYYNPPRTGAIQFHSRWWLDKVHLDYKQRELRWPNDDSIEIYSCFEIYLYKWVSEWESIGLFKWELPGLEDGGVDREYGVGEGGRDDRTWNGTRGPLDSPIGGISGSGVNAGQPVLLVAGLHSTFDIHPHGMKFKFKIHNDYRCDHLIINTV